MSAAQDDRARLGQIVAACRDWNAQAKVYIPDEINTRAAHGTNPRRIAKALSGLFAFPPKNAPKRVFLFQGMRAQHLWGLFPKDQVYVIGTGPEGRRVKAMGYHFIPDFAIERSVKLSVYQGVDALAYRTLRRWRSWIKDRDVTVFLYEDTQPVGAFFAHLEDYGTATYRAACLQHGHYCGFNPPYRPEGRLTEYNLVWDRQQGDWISDRPDKTAVMGLSYEAKAAPAGPTRRVVLVGLGMPDLQDKAMGLFLAASRALEAAFDDIEILYRPHPFEFRSPKGIEACAQAFGQIDRTEKLDLLNGPRSLFLGEVSSLLYEAKQTGHIAAYMSVNPNQLPTGYHDVTFEPGNEAEFVRAVRDAFAADAPDGSVRAAHGDPQQRFLEAVRSLRLD